MKVLIVDDEPLSRELSRALLSEVEDVEIAGEAESGADALAAIAYGGADTVFLDIDMPGRNGIQTAIELVPQDVDIVFLTAHEDYAVDAFELGAADYLLKPLRRPRLAKALARVRQRQQARRAQTVATEAAVPERADEDVFWVPVLKGVARVEMAAIQRVEAARDHVYFHTADRAYLYRATMAELEPRLAAGGLMRVHRSAFVRPSAVREVHRRGKVTSFTLTDNVIIAVGPSYRAQALAALKGERQA